MLRSRLYLCLAALIPAIVLTAVGLDRASAHPLLFATSSSMASDWIPGAIFPGSDAPATSTATANSPNALDPDTAATTATPTITPEDHNWLDEWRQGNPSPPQGAIIPVLMYHHVAPIDYSRANALEADLTVLPTEFEKQLAYMQGRGYHSISLQEVWNYFQGGDPLPPRAVVLTFDDGYNDVYSYAYPLLTRYGFRGTFFIITGLLGGPRYMAMGQVLDLFQAGMEIGAHSSIHPSLTGLSASRLVQELVWPKKQLEEVTGAPVDALAYPNGAYNQTVVQAARNAGYRVAVTTRFGAAQLRDKLLEMVRVRVHGAESITTFRQQMERYN